MTDKRFNAPVAGISSRKEVFLFRRLLVRESFEKGSNDDWEEGNGSLLADPLDGWKFAIFAITESKHDFPGSHENFSRMPKQPNLLLHVPLLSQGVSFSSARCVESQLHEGASFFI